MKIIITDFRPIPLKRPRYNKTTASVFDSQKAEKQALALILKSYFKVPINNPISLELEFNYLSKKKGVHGSRPDIDNLIKFVLDAGNGIAWTDDALVYKISAIKNYTDNNSIVLIVQP